MLIVVPISSNNNTIAYTGMSLARCSADLYCSFGRLHVLRWCVICVAYFGLSLGFALYFYQNHACILPDIVLWKSKKPQKLSINEVKRTNLHCIIDCFLEK